MKNMHKTLVVLTLCTASTIYCATIEELEQRYTYDGCLSGQLLDDIEKNDPRALTFIESQSFDASKPCTIWNKGIRIEIYPFAAAASAGNITMMDALLKKNTTVLNQQNPFNTSHLEMVLGRTENPDGIRYIIQKDPESLIKILEELNIKLPKALKLEPETRQSGVTKATEKLLIEEAKKLTNGQEISESFKAAFNALRNADDQHP